MKILFLAHVLPYPVDAGPKVRIYYVLRYLAQKHEITLLAFVRNEKEKPLVEHLRTFCHSIHTVPIKRSPARDALQLLSSLGTGQPFLIARDNVAAMHQAAQRLATENGFDVVHADQLAMAQYAVHLPGGKKVLDQHNAVWTIVQRLWQNERPGPRRWLMEREWHKLQKYEADICRRFDHVIAVTEQDQRALQAISDRPLPITVLPICIDPDDIHAEPNAAAKNVISIGGMFYPPNVDGMVWFGREVFPLIHRESSTTRVVIIGARPDSRVARLAKNDPSIHVMGYVGNTTPYLHDSAVFVVPLRAGGGMRVKILDAWARGIPVVSTTIGCEGIQVLPEENILIADSPTAFAQAVLRILRDPALGRRLAENGRRWVEERYNWRVVYKKLDEIYCA